MPLLSMFSVSRSIALLLAVGGLCACNSPVSHFYATGYVADQGIMRVWRRDDDEQQQQVLMSVYSPLDEQGNTIVSYFEYQKGQLHQLRQTIHGSDGLETLQLRMNSRGEIVFMQRQKGDRRTALTQDDIARTQYQSQHVLSVSTALRIGQVKLNQGRWEQGRLVNCAGKIQLLKLESGQLQWLAKRAAKNQRPLGLAWLEAPEGTQLLLVADEDFCSWEPKQETMIKPEDGNLVE